MNVLVTGSNGFIGLSLAQSLKADDYLLRNSVSQDETLAKSSGFCKCVKADLTLLLQFVFSLSINSI